MTRIINDETTVNLRHLFLEVKRPLDRDKNLRGRSAYFFGRSASKIRFVMTTGWVKVLLLLASAYLLAYYTPLTLQILINEELFLTIG